MVFSSLLFLFVFLPAFFAAYYLAPRRFRNDVALLGSLFFYAWGAPRFVVALIVSSTLDYGIGILLHRYRNQPNTKSALLGISVVANISLLLYFKYANFFAEQLQSALTALGLSSFTWTTVALPIGISFFTFHKLSYTVDVYRGIVAPAKNFATFLLYLALFPQLIAGPIIRYHVIEEQLRVRTHSWDLMFSGFSRFCLGLGKKVLIADSMGEVANAVFGAKLQALSSAHAWLGAFAYSFQIYFDFSGYSDMAIGLGMMMGFRFPENFNNPYISENITDFWRRWHMTLSSWMREYLYIPLGGNRVSTWRRYLNLWTVFLLSGLWHGANWTFIVWGVYHGLFLVLDKLFLLRVTQRFAKPFRIVFTFFLVMIGWVFFRADSIHEAVEFLHKMFSFTAAPNPLAKSALDFLSNRSLAMLCIACLISFLPAFKFDRLRKYFAERFPQPLLPWASGAFACLLLIVAAANITNSQFHPFIYFRF